MHLRPYLLFGQTNIKLFATRSLGSTVEQFERLGLCRSTSVKTSERGLRGESSITNTLFSLSTAVKIKVGHTGKLIYHTFHG